MRKSKAKKNSVTLAFALLLLLMPFLPGCAFEDIDRRAFVTAIGVDQAEVSGKKYSLILKISLSKSDPKAIGCDFTLLKVNCNSISEGLERLRSMSDKKLEYGHVKALIIGEEVAKQEIAPLLDYFMKRPDIQKLAYLGVAKPNGYELLQFKPKEEAVAGSFMFFTFERSRTQSPYVNPVPLFDAYRRITNPGLDLALPVLEMNQGILQVNKVALFDKKRLQEELSPEESKLLKLLTTGIHDHTMTLNARNNTYTVTTETGKTTYHLTGGGGPQTAILAITMQGTLIEKQDDPGMITEATKRELERQATDQIQKQVRRLLVKMSSEQLDPIGFGLRDRARHLNHTNETQNWQTIYPHLSFKVIANYKIKTN